MTTEELAGYRDHLLSSLLDVMTRLSDTVDAMPAKSWYVKFGAEGTTPHFILSHLREIEVQVFGLQLHRIQKEDNPLLPYFNDSAWMKAHYKPKDHARIILADIVNLRKYELQWLKALPPAAWNRTARHAQWGERTFQWWVELQLEYTNQHLNQLVAFRAM